jgi:hypothetical protein
MLIRPPTLKEKYEQWKNDLDRTLGNSWESLLGRHFDRMELNRLNRKIRILDRSLRLNPLQKQLAKELEKVREEYSTLQEQMRLDMKKAKSYESVPKLIAKDPKPVVNITPILKKESVRRDSKISFAQEAQEIEYGPKPIVRTVSVHFNE